MIAASSVLVREAALDELTELHAGIPELKPLSGPVSYQERIGDRAWLGLVAEVEREAVAFKLGYWLDDRIFYSWVGGVLPTARRLGLARTLLREQERRVTGSGARELRVKSMNRYPGMMQLLLSEGYLITGIEGEDPGLSKIHFTKTLEAAGEQ